ncbi:P-loop containing nucleoside triphosphate hydrolase protein [Sporormia fimetaria CBS 119925]|uniref:P-loop containing nucleoside triphosphate hydrolase protein n=1 Tax=Sporormia fimetaria CBS 119925 TaxID=1340428 RepID=A0A6A6VP48_9PLEO|nr:P-loop containing nucleoside triphosphate hydrolase protein [Sporormia fimetaria CBS 119925]
MASISIFTFEHDPPRVSSPWATPPLAPQSNRRLPQASASGLTRSSFGDARVSAVEGSGITKLEAEPQDGPTEYKLHLLLRRRRSFARTTTGRQIPGSLRRTESPILSSSYRSVSESSLQATAPTPLATTQSRQHRLEQLTTQLYWRLQQSCPHHVSSSRPLIVPQFPDESKLSASAVPQQLLPGLEESKGALYEIGVADDGTFVGLAEDEMEESLNNLRAMAASLGCVVDVLRMVQVGECEWVDSSVTSEPGPPATRRGELWVAEAFVHPQQYFIDSAAAEYNMGNANSNGASNPAGVASSSSVIPDTLRTTQHLRVSLTGATTSGKSSLLGSLSTSTLDNGRGKSRLSLLKHRHEIASGMTSSVTQELIGYQDVLNEEGTRTSSHVISYGTGDVSEWLDIHAAAEGGRLVLLSDSAGHPRYRRTTVRGLVGWDPHWTLLCISADTSGNSPMGTQESTGTVPEADLSEAHLKLCLNLELPLVVVITKYDLATKQGLRQTLSRILSAIKDAGRTPRIVSNTAESIDLDLNEVPGEDLDQAGSIVEQLKESALAVVPILLTSAVKGTGINRLHAFLRTLPIPAPAAPQNDLRMLLHIEDVYNNVPSAGRDTPSQVSPSHRPVVLAGHVRYGTLHIGTELLLGPYNVDSNSDDSDSGPGSTTPNRRQRQHAEPVSRSFPGAFRRNASTSSLRSKLTPHERDLEWRRVRITSLRNLRLPVTSLHAGEVGTIGVTPVDAPIVSPSVVRIRKGMVLVNGAAKSNRGIVVRFTGTNAEAVKSLGIGSGVVVYVASVRASAKVVSVAKYVDRSKDEQDEEDGFGFGFDDDEEGDMDDSGIAVTFQFIASREFFEVDAKVLVLPGGGTRLYGGLERGEKGVPGLDGFVGRVVDGS